MMRRHLLTGAAALLSLAALSTLAAPAWGADPPSEPTITELLNAADDINRGGSSVATMTMTVKTARYERSVTMKAWTRGTEESLVSILAPAKEKGTATLKVGDNIWNYLPKVDRTVKVPASMMSGAWMGSHLTNDDLVKGSRMAEDYTATITTRPNAGVGDWVIDLVPHDDAPVVWGKVVLTIRADMVPTSITYFDEDAELIRTLAFDQIKDIGGRPVPARMRVVPADKPDEFTEIVYDSLEFDVQIEDRTFSLQALRR